MFLTLISQHIGVETQEVGAEVDPALVWHSSFPVAAREICHKLLFLRQYEQTFKAQHCLPEALGIFLVTCGFALLCYQTLHKHNIPPLKSTTQKQMLDLISKIPENTKTGRKKHLTVCESQITLSPLSFPGQNWWCLHQSQTQREFWWCSAAASPSAVRFPLKMLLYTHTHIYYIRIWMESKPSHTH